MRWFLQLWLCMSLVPLPLVAIQAKAYLSLADPDQQLTSAQRAAIWQKLLLVNRGEMKFRILVLRSLPAEQLAERLSSLSQEISAERHAVLLLVIEQKIFQVMVSEKALAQNPLTSLDTILQQSLPYLRSAQYDKALLTTLESLEKHFAK